jgi:hypothetical protein
VSVLAPDPQAEPLLEPFYELVDLSDPAAGANLTVPQSRVLGSAIVAARCLFVADGNAANRVVSLDYIARGVTYVRNTPAQVFIASSSTSLEWQANLAMWDGNANAPTLIPLLSIPLPSAVTVRFTVDNIQAGDQLSAAHLVVERFTVGEAERPRFRRR